MKKTLIAILFVLPLIAKAECVNLNVQSYEVECTGGQCVNPTRQPAKSVDFHLDNAGQSVFSQTRQISVYKTLTTGVKVQKVDAGFNITLTSVFVVNGSEFGKREETTLVANLVNFPKISLYGGAITHNNVTYASRLNVLASDVACHN